MYCFMEEMYWMGWIVLQVCISDTLHFIWFLFLIIHQSISSFCLVFENGAYHGMLLLDYWRGSSLKWAVIDGGGYARGMGINIVRHFRINPERLSNQRSLRTLLLSSLLSSCIFELSVLRKYCNYCNFWNVFLYIHK